MAAVLLLSGSTVHKKAKQKAIAKKPVAAVVKPNAALLPIAEETVAGPSHIASPEGLGSFFESLEQARASKAPVHILQFGDSHTASDDWVSEMRTGLQSRYGSGGPGFTMAGRPFKGYRRYDVSGSSSEGWTSEGTVMHQGDGREGLSGISITAQAPNQTVTLKTSGQLLEIHYLQQASGGSFEFAVDGRPIDVVSTVGDQNAGIYRYQPEPGEHEYRLRTLSAHPVRLFGWVSDYSNGVTFETLGINGAQANLLRNWDSPIWQAEVASRKPSLVILAYGTNEANSPKWTPERYIAELQDVIVRVRLAAPDSSILMIGPPDCGKLQPLAHLDQVVYLQSLIAQQNGIAFWNWRERMGGSRAIVKWAQAGYGQPDHIHLTGLGYRLIGRVLVQDLLTEYNSFLALRAQRAENSYGPTK